MTDAHDPGFHVERIDLRDGRAELRFSGQLRFRQCFASWQNVRRLARPPAAHLAFDIPERTQPAPLLEQLVSEGRGFYDD